jgi:hypothetical protein
LNDPDANRIFTSSSAEVRAYFQTNGVCSFEFAEVENQPVDGAALAEKVRVEINEVRDDLNALFGRQTYLTRLYSTLSPVEMDRDPLFDFNPDLADVPNVRTATARVSCEDGVADTQSYELITSTGVRVQVREGANPMAIRRRDGLTVQQGAMPAAAVVERLSTSGPPEIIQAADLPTGGADAGAGGGGGGPGNFDAGTGGSGGGGGAGQVSSGDDDGCSTRPGAGGGALGLVLAAFGLTALSRRRGSRSQSST